MSRPRFLADDDLNHAIVVGARRRESKVSGTFPSMNSPDILVASPRGPATR
jgi:hypothetical protein